MFDLKIVLEGCGLPTTSRPDAVEPESEPTDITADIFTSVSPQKFATYLAFTHDVLVPADLTNINISAFVLGPCGGDITCRTVMTPHIPFLPQPPPWRGDITCETEMTPNINFFPKPPPVTFTDPFKECERFALPDDLICDVFCVINA
ncbi:hypothetical protein RF11_10243 [Thelohanellus kitauei]|uniref:Uncharacterized protein n=1 Tax=Thelohanellus kitauei TaxID=669202 RepID=A0A0C2N774_THEKT|nr:hypothetical protein RF11_10243 [Thelohanellus kitauei]